MSKANKFTEKGTVTIAARQKQENGRDWVTLSVADTGIGMTPEQMATPWTRPLYQDSQSPFPAATPVRFATTIRSAQRDGDANLEDREQDR
jgi:hypothetical protein